MNNILHSDARARLEVDGYLLLSGVCDPRMVEELREHCEGLFAVSIKERAVGLRNLLHRDAMLTGLAHHGLLPEIASCALGDPAEPVRLILFDKRATANWSVPWHQDVNIAVSGRIVDPGYGPWSVKEGVPHVVPPAPVLERMVTLRLHLDDCTPSTGALRVAPGTHRAGIVREIEMDIGELSISARDCPASAGDLLLMRPLLFHSSGKATHDARRRVIHVEYAARTLLPKGLGWYFAPSAA